MAKSGYCFFLSKWEDNKDQIQSVREAVFVKELGFPARQIRNDSDPECYHVLAYDANGQTIGTGCIHPDGKIGQIAVLPSWRGRTVGKALLIYLLQIAKTLHLPSVWVNAEEPMFRFYQSKNFQPTDKTMVIEGRPYRKMVHVIEQRRTLN